MRVSPAKSFCTAVSSALVFPFGLHLAWHEVDVRRRLVDGDGVDPLVLAAVDDAVSRLFGGPSRHDPHGMRGQGSGAEGGRGLLRRPIAEVAHVDEAGVRLVEGTPGLADLGGDVGLLGSGVHGLAVQPAAIGERGG